MTKVDLYLNDWLLSTHKEIENIFYLDGVKEYQSHFMWRDYDSFINCYIASRWWIFSNRN